MRSLALPLAVARGDVAGWSGDTMTVTPEPRGMTQQGGAARDPGATARISPRVLP